MNQLTQTDAQRITDLLVPFIANVKREYNCDQVDYCEDKVILRSDTKEITIKIIVNEKVRSH